MKIYILRHEDRTQDCSFFAPLTETGLSNAKNLVDKLKEVNINLIFSSPFIRTLQTVYPYAKETELKINLEYGLSELHHPDIIPIKAVGISLPEYLAVSFNYEPIYKTIIKPTDIKYPETDKLVVNRIKHVLKDIISKYYETDVNILLVSHQSICNAILKIVNSSSEKFKGKLPDKVVNGYQKGKLCLIFDKGWTYKPLN
jgi:2,3-bisphosphoglycerate-dependent phosphoglycerate mutase